MKHSEYRVVEIGGEIFYEEAYLEDDTVMEISTFPAIIRDVNYAYMVLMEYALKKPVLKYKDYS